MSAATHRVTVVMRPTTAAAATCRLTRYIMFLLSIDRECVCRPIAMGRRRPELFLYETGPLGRLLRDLRLGAESALAPADLDEPALDQILDRLPHGRAADFEPVDQALFGRQLGLRGQAAVSDIAGQNRLGNISHAGGCCSLDAACRAANPSVQSPARSGTNLKARLARLRRFDPPFCDFHRASD
jgi:hypothetical protein